VRGTIEVVAVDGAQVSAAEAYAAREPIRWAERVWAELSDAFEVYPPDLADRDTLKACCSGEPGHAAPHDVIDPLDEQRPEDRRLRNVARGYVSGETSGHILEASAAATRWPNALADRIAVECSGWRSAAAREADLRTRIARALEEE
jgi:hypothetical protein